MRRTGALTLGVVILTLGAVTGGRTQALSGSVTTADSSPFGNLILPAVPENWSDLPLKLTASQSISYNSNVNSFPIGVAPVGAILGDFTETTNFGFTTNANVSNQQLFVDANFGVIRYLRDKEFDSTIYNVNAGVNWNITSRCSGTLAVSLSKSPAEVTELVGSGVNYTTSNAINETGKCAVSNGYSVLFNAGLTDLTNTNPIDAVNDTRSTLLSAGLEYEKGPTTVTALASISKQDFTSRTAAESAIGLATETDFHSFTLSYTRQINPNLSVTGLLGIVGVTDGFSLGLPKTLLPIYTLSTNWALTPKLSLNASASRTISPPTTVIANAQTSYAASLALIYQLTPKISLNATGSIGYDLSTFTSNSTLDALSPFLTQSQNTYTVNVGMNYGITPFISAALNASYSERVSDHFITPQDVVTVSLNYKPY